MERIQADNDRTISVSAWDGHGVFVSMQGNGFSTYLSMTNEKAQQLIEAIQNAMKKEEA